MLFISALPLPSACHWQFRISMPCNFAADCPAGGKLNEDRAAAVLGAIEDGRLLKDTFW